MKLETRVNFLGKEEISGKFTPLQILEMLDKKIVEIRKMKEGV